MNIYLLNIQRLEKHKFLVPFSLFSVIFSTFSGLAVVSDLFNPFKLKIVSYFYQLDKSISVLKFAGWSVSFLFNFQKKLL